MTSNTTPSGIASASSEGSWGAPYIYPAWKAFNHSSIDNLDAWLTASNMTTGWLSYEFTSPKVISKYTLLQRKGQSSSAPKSWTFEAFDGVNWIILDTKTNITGGGGSPYYTISKSYNVGPFLGRKDYIVFDKILSFEVMEY